MFILVLDQFTVTRNIMKQENKYKSQRKERKLVPGHKISTLQKYQEVDSKYLIPFLHKLPSSFITM